MDLQQAFDLLAATLDGVAAAAIGHLAVDWHLGDVEQTVRLELSNGTLHATPGMRHAEPDVVVHGDRSQVDRLFDSDATVGSLLDEGAITATGDVERLQALFACVTEFPRFYNIIEP